MDQRLILRPAAGLANRMRAIDSAVALCRRAGRPLDIVWFKDHALMAPFHALFEPIDLPGVSLREASWADYLTLDVPYFRRNLKIPLVYQRLRFRPDSRMDLNETSRRYREKLPIEVLFSGSRRCYVASGSQMTPTEDRFAMFRPVPEIQRRIQDKRECFERARCVGVHVRRGDHRQASMYSPLELFMDRMRQDLDGGLCDTFYLATDSEEARTRLRDAFGSRIVTLDRQTDRQSIQGMQDAVLDLYALASTHHVLGSCGSTFGQTAAWIANIPYAELRSTPQQ